MPIYKAELTVTVLAEYPDGSRFAEALQGASLSEIADMTDLGDWIGQIQGKKITEVPPQDVRKELEAIGNDGTFFEEPEEHDAPAPGG